MSRRKQGRPQQRKTQDSLEQENDLLVCGDCHTSFPLRDIVKFIRHKKLCCNKENVESSDSAHRKPDSSNNNEISGDRNDEGDDDDDDDDEDVDLTKPSSRIEDDAILDNDIENEDGSTKVVRIKGLINGEKTEVLRKEERIGRKEERSGKKEEKVSMISSSSRELRIPLRQRQVVDAESNTTHSEPSRFVCETCRSTYTSAWGLLQHAQQEHGMKIYTSPSSTNGHYQHSSSSASTPVTSSISPIDLMVASSPRTGLDHRSMSTGSGGSASPFPVHTSNPFSSPFRLPLDSRLSQQASLGLFARPTFDFDLINDYRLIARGAAGLDPTSFSHARSHVSPALDSQLDFYSMRLKQLASSPVVPQSKSPFPGSSQPQGPNFAVTPTSTKSDSPPAEASLISSPRRNSLAPAFILPPKQKACEFCGKTFRFQSNLVVHRRSHTGEKPYKCPRCPHACTQQSKLKRHMKTHLNKTEGDASPNTTLNHKEGSEVNEDGDDDEDDDDEDDDEEECEEECEEDEEDMMEENVNEEEQGVIERLKEENIKKEQTPEPGEVCHEAKKIKLEVTNEDKGQEYNLPSDLSVKSKRTESLLSEVMKKTGLNDIQTYSEAYRAALAESQENGRKRCQDRSSADSTSRDGADTPKSSSQKSLRTGLKRELDSEKEHGKDDEKDHSDEADPSKQESSSVWPSGLDAVSGSNIDPAAASIYSRLHPSWFHADNPVRLFFPGYPPRFSNSRDLTLNPENHNGLTFSPSLSSTSSALKTDNQNLPALLKPRSSSPPSYASHYLGTSSTSNSPTGNLLLPSNGNNAINTPRKESKRNDTCEYCGKVFKNCSNLTVHRRSHTGEKPYKCNLCSYACAQSSKLTRHMKTHGRLGKDVFTCKFCNMPFSVPSTLEKHMRKCVENRNARLLATDQGDISSESNGELSIQSDSASGVC